ncbi:hypothetical protein BGZ92_000637, partial [Podila epicladia]
DIADARQLSPSLSVVKSAVIQARTPQTPEEEALRQRIAEVYFERAELLEKLGNPDKAQASYKKAQAWGYEERHPASIPSAVLLSASGLPPVAQITERGKQLRPGLIQKLSLDKLEEQLVPEESEYLCYLAFQGLQDNRIEFDDAYLNGVTKTLNQQRRKDRKDLLPLALSDDLKRISFLHTADTERPEAERHYHFPHLTFQEYF